MKLHPLRHFVGLLLFGLVAFFVLTLPMMVMGFPYEMPNIAGLHGGSLEGSRLLPLLLSPFNLGLDVESVSCWIKLNVIALILSILPLWWCVYRIFDERKAWAAAVLFPFIPIHWVQALRMDGYAFGYFFLFLAGAFFIESGLPPLKKRVPKNQQLICIALAGICMGFAVAVRDAFILFLPGIVLAAVSHSWGEWKVLVRGLGVFLVCVFLAFSLPIVPEVREADASVVEKIDMIIGTERGMPQLLHFYPDLYTYEFQKEEFLAAAREEVASWSWLERQGAANYMQLFGAHSRTLVSTLYVGSWLLLGSIPLLFAQDFVGGIFLWLFIIPGSVFFYKKKKHLLFHLVWLALSLELTTRYIFFAQRPHVMDYGWILVVLAGIGLVVLLDKVKPHRSLVILVPLIVALQFAQANRAQIARFYNRSNTQAIYTATEEFNKLPADAVIAHPPALSDHFYLTDRARVPLAQETVTQLAAKGELGNVLQHYGITHSFGYDAAPRRVLVVRVPRQDQLVRAPSKVGELLLHMFR